MPEDSCYGCTRRHVGCHSDCLDYERYLIKRQAIKDARDKENIYRGYRMGVTETILRKDALKRQKKDRTKRNR